MGGKRFLWQWYTEGESDTRRKLADDRLPTAERGEFDPVDE